MTKKKDLSDTIALYEEILSGKRQRFPRYTWNPLKGGFDNYRKVIRYLVLDKLQLDRQQLMRFLSMDWLEEYGLRKGLEYTYGDFVTLVEDCFPEFEIQPWELHYNARRQETDPASVLRWLLSEKLGWSRKDIVMNFSGNTLRAHGLYKLYTSGREPRSIRLYALLREAFPEHNFRHWEFRWFRQAPDIARAVVYPQDGDGDHEAREAYYDDIARQEAANPPCAIHDAINCSICNAWVKA
jgi:hypothetical protein